MHRLILFVLITLAAMSAVAAMHSTAPAALKPWQDWVLEKHPDSRCPRLDARAATRRCAWPGVLAIDVTSSGASFSQTWETYGESWLGLPGDRQHWPLAVQVDAQPLAVLERNNRPMLRLGAGKHHIRGELQWRQRPQFLQIPMATGLVTVSIDGKTLSWPNIDNRGRLWFKRPDNDTANSGKGDSVKVEVFRRLNDGVPITLDTVLRIAVAGRPRELQLGRLLPGDSEVTQFQSALPARIEADGSLRIQVRAGNWQLRLASRFTTPVTHLGMTRSVDDWPTQEIWSFAAAPNIRGVKITGVEALDPSRLDLPQSWRKLPTYLVEPTSRFTLEQQYRGDVAPGANQITSRRTLWLDFDGSGATVMDTLSGSIRQGWRLSVQPGIHLGRVTVNGIPQLITRLADAAADGVEIRQAQLNLVAISRLAEHQHLSAGGWQNDVDSLAMTLNLPPGWQLWHAGGADSVQHSWLSRWDLWDLFLCLLIVGATFKLLGLPWAVLATLTLALSYHEHHAPIITWVVLIVVIPLLQVLPQGGLRNLIAKLGYLSLLALVIISLGFAVQQIRRGLYPQLEQQGLINARADSYNRGAAQARAKRKAGRLVADAPQEGVPQSTPAAALSLEQAARATELKKDREQAGKTPQPRYQPSANTQTGPGQPTWSWHRVSLGWSGPVSADAGLDLYLSPPWLSRSLVFVQVLLLGLLVYGYGRLLLPLARRREAQPGPGPATSATPGAATAILVLAALISGTPDKARAADGFPPDYLLKDWEQRLTQAPDCAPNCLAINAVQLSVAGTTLQLRLRIGTGTELGVPLPSDKTWQLKRVLINGLAGEQVARVNGRLWLPLPAGNNEVLLSGQIRGDTLDIPFPLVPHNVSVSAAGWEVSGLVDGRVPGKSLQLHRREQATSRDALLPDPVAPFVRVERQLIMNIDWHIYTTVHRLAPPQGGLSVAIPLLPGESVVSEGVKVSEANGRRKVTATFSAGQASVSWHSVLKPVTSITFTAAKNPLFVESWSVQSSPRWHLRYSGLTPIKNSGRQQAAIPRWLPWPGEQLQLKVDKPRPVPGATTTVESVAVNSQPGNRSTKVTLQVKIRSSLGGDFRIQQPDRATLERIEIDGRELPRQVEGNTVILPLHPGLQQARLQWLIAAGVRLSTATPPISLSTPASNINLTLSLPQSRWPLLVGGPAIGPAMLYWGVLIVILAVAIALGRSIKQRQLSIPVNAWQWVLLALGMSTVNMAGSVAVVLWFFAMEARARFTLPAARWKFNLLQLGLVLLSIIAVIALFATIPESLLSTPDMQVAGNGSHNYFYNWYQDRSPGLLPRGYVISVPIWVYRITMLAWSLWLVFALLRWAKWGWQCYSREQLWAGKAVK